MKIDFYLPILLLASLVSSKSLSFLGNSQERLGGSDSDLKVPGDNPLEFCEKHAEDILVIKHVNLSPNPPKAGQTLTIEASGYLKEDVEKGAKIHFQVKYGLIRLINGEADLCDQIKEVDLECPLKKGDIVLTKSVELPKEVPPGGYTVLADVYTKDDDKITCLTASVRFGPK